MPTSRQFICKKCGSLVLVESFEHTREGIPFCRCSNCNAKNALVDTGATASQPGLIPVTGLIK